MLLLRLFCSDLSASLFKNESSAFDSFVHHLVRNTKTGEGVKVVGEALVVVDLAPDTAFSESDVQDLAVVSEAVLFCSDDVARRKLGQVVCQGYEVSWTIMVDVIMR
jgi:hypothetical protein